MNLADALGPDRTDGTALVAAGRRWSYPEVWAEAGRVRAALTRCGVGPGDVVALLAGTSPTFVAGWLGVLAAGGIAAPCNPLAPAAELVRELAVVRPKAVVVGAAAAGVDPSILQPAAVLWGPGHDRGAPDWQDDEPDMSPPVPRDGSEPAVLLFTSGTSARPRAAVLTHENLRVNQRQVLAHLGDAIRPGDTALCALPLFHVLALNGVLGLTLAVGGTVVLQPRFDPVAALAAVAEHDVAVLVGAPPMWQAFAALDDDRLAPLRRLRVAASGAAPLPRPVAARLRSAGVPVAEAYGLTEAAPAVCTAVATDAPIGSVGPPLPGIELRIVGPDGDDVLVGDEGELLVRGPNVFAGYLDDPGATSAVLGPDGWLRTGDLGVVDDHGNVSIVGRCKDIVIVSGFNVSPREVEDVLLEHPGVAAVAVHGVPHPETGEAVHARVVAGGPGLDLDALHVHCEQRLARYKCPAAIELVPELATGTMGKSGRRDQPGSREPTGAA